MRYTCEHCKTQFNTPKVIVVPMYGTDTYDEAEVCPYCEDPDFVDNRDDQY